MFIFLSSLCPCATDSIKALSTCEHKNIFLNENGIISYEIIWWGFFLALISGFVITLCCLKSHNIRKVVYRNLLSFAIALFILGWILYFIGYIHPLKDFTNDLGGSILIWLQAGGRAFLSAFSMFIFDSDLIEVAEEWHHNTIFMACFSIVHFFGVLISTIVIMRILGDRGDSWFQLKKERVCLWWNKSIRPLFKFRKRANDNTTKSKTESHSNIHQKVQESIYVFWGINEAGITLANSIKEKCTESKTRNLFFIETPSEEELEIKEFSLTHFFTSSLHGNPSYDRIKSIGGLVLYPKQRLVEFGKQQNQKESQDQKNEKDKNQKKDLFDELCLSDLGKVCERYQLLNFFFLSNDELKNIQDMLIMKKDFQDKKIPQIIHLYCRARRNQQHLIYEEDITIKNENTNIHVHIIDDANIAVLGLKRNKEYQPISLIKNKINEKAQVTTSFNSLFLGFGQTGRDAFRFVYEFSAFVSKDNKRSPSQADIYDVNMNRLKGDFLLQTPALRKSYEDDTIINFHDTDIKDLKFWDNYEMIVNKLNYVVVALGDDETNLNTAITLYKTALKHSRHKEETDFYIFVRIYNKEYEAEANLIENHLNPKNLDKKDDEDNIDKSKCICKIIPFGQMDNIYTYDNIISDETSKEAALFESIYGEYYSFYDIKTWDNKDKNNELEEIHSNIKKYYNDYSENKLSISLPTENHKKSLFTLWEYYRTLQQNLSNAWHVYTKIILFEQAKSGIVSNDLDIKHTLENLYDLQLSDSGDFIIRDPKTNNYYVRNSETGKETPINKSIQDILDTIAHCEHLRWNAKSELQGYIFYSKPKEPYGKDIIGKRLQCLRPWDKSWNKYPITTLKDECNDKLVYDYNTIDVSFIIIQKRNSHGTNN